MNQILDSPFSPELLENLPPTWTHLIRKQKPDCLFLREKARCSIWKQSLLSFQNLKTAILGHFLAETEQDGIQLLKEACGTLQVEGFECVIGPMDGSTWNSYRLITQKGTRPPFYLEMQHPEFYPACFLHADFHSIGAYVSSFVDQINNLDPRLEKVRKRLIQEGVRLRNWDSHAPLEELKKIHTLSLSSFQNNFLYTPIEWHDFYALYEPILDKIHPDFVLIAELGDEAVGFVFAIPDMECPQMDTFLIKTLAILPGRRFAGLGSVLVEEVCKDASKLGMKHAIHVYMHVSNHSRNIGEAVPFRHYEIFGCILNRS